MSSGCSPSSTDSSATLRLVTALTNPALWPWPVQQVEVIETHISFVFLLGPYACKLKKPVNLGFLDFSSLERRRFCCEEEVRLNRRFAPSVYLGVIPITGSLDQPSLQEDGEPIEWLVKMRRLDAHGVLADQPQRLDLGLIHRLAEDIARFHLAAASVNGSQPYGSMGQVLAPMRENVRQIRERVREAEVVILLDAISHWTEQEGLRLAAVMEARREQGMVRECHGDLHLGNILLDHGQPVIFDGIEFSPQLRWIDTISDLAFLLMDLSHRGRPDLANCLLNRYLERTGDYQGTGVLTLYQVYRAMVRAKVAAIRMGQLGEGDRLLEELHQECLSYLRLAHTFIRPRPIGIFITVGLSGSGKSTGSEQLLGMLPLLRIRSDVERKRLAQAGVALYDEQMTRRTYQQLLDMARAVLTGGRSVLLDATFLQRWQRKEAQSLAQELGVPMWILRFEQTAEELRRRIAFRQQHREDISDADLSVLEWQRAQQQPLTADEQTLALLATGESKLLAEAIAIRLGLAPDHNSSVSWWS